MGCFYMIGFTCLNLQYICVLKCFSIYTNMNNSIYFFTSRYIGQLIQLANVVDLVMKIIEHKVKWNSFSMR